MSELWSWGALNWVLGLGVAAAALAAAGHALLNKREPQSALGWIAVCLMFPVAGPLLYYVFGFNRIRTRAKRLTAEDPEAVSHRSGLGAPHGLPHGLPYSRPSQRENAVEGGLEAILRTSELVTGLPLRTGNEIVPLENGDETYPAMVAAVASARTSVYLATYIFDPGAVATQLIDALAEAVDRGVRVRVLVDGVGEYYGRPRIVRLLERAGVPAARFLPPRLLPPQLHINLRNHRKILVADGARGFTGGINIRDCHLSDHPSPHTDLHCAVRGPVVRQIERVFREDWEFVTGESLPASPASLPDAGTARARVIVDGPNEDIDRLTTILIGAASAASERFWIVTPYFLPPRELIGAMKAAALRGVEVAVLLPAENNLPIVHWAARNVLLELLHWGVRVYYQPRPFAHTKLILVDREYLHFGSANLDPRSLRLNFELSLEVVDPAVNAHMAERFSAWRARASEISPEQLEARPLWIRARDAAAWLFSPYL